MQHRLSIYLSVTLSTSIWSSDIGHIIVACMQFASPAAVEPGMITEALRKAIAC